jgi:hypothetical protein
MKLCLKNSFRLSGKVVTEILSESIMLSHLYYIWLNHFKANISHLFALIDGVSSKANS